MAQQHASRDEAYVNAMIEQLRERYLGHRPLPGSEATPLTLAQFYRFYHYILAEGYGNAGKPVETLQERAC
jgi:hypothetical protein